MRIKNYFKHVWKNGWLDTMEQEEQVLSTLSGALKEELHYNDKVIFKIIRLSYIIGENSK